MKKRKESKEQIIIHGMNAIDKNVRNIRNTASKYDKMIIESITHRNDAKARKYIIEKISLNKFASTLEEAKNDINMSITRAQAFSDLTGLKQAITACKGILREVPEISKLSDDLSSILRELDASEKDLIDLSQTLTEACTSSLSDNFTEGYGDIENTPEFKAELESALQKVRGTLDSVDSNSNNTEGLDSISALIDKINNEDKK